MAKSQVAHISPELQVPCRTCGETKPYSEFYPRQIVKDMSHGECKDCTCLKVRMNRNKNIDQYRSYDRKRYREDDDRKARCIAMGNKTPMGKRVADERERRLADPQKYKARLAVRNGLRDGKIRRGEHCFFCNAQEKLQAHHHDYSKPLDVFWLCPKCHGKLHTINGDLHRPKPKEIT